LFSGGMNADTSDAHHWVGVEIGGKSN